MANIEIYSHHGIDQETGQRSDIYFCNEVKVNSPAYFIGAYFDQDEGQYKVRDFGFKNSAQAKALLKALRDEVGSGQRVIFDDARPGDQLIFGILEAQGVIEQAMTDGEARIDNLNSLTASGALSKYEEAGFAVSFIRAQHFNYDGDDRVELYVTTTTV